MTYADATLERWTIEGVDLSTYAYTIESRAGWDTLPARRGDPIEIPNRHGAYTNPQKYFAAANFALDIVILDTDAAGQVTHPQGALGHLQQNLDNLKALLYSTTLLTVDRTMADGTTRRAYAEAAAAVPVEQVAHTALKIRALFTIPAGTWLETPANTINLPSGAGNIVAGGNAPIGDSIWTLTYTAAASALTITAGAATVDVLAGGVQASDQVTIDNGARRVYLNGSPADAALKIHQADWIEIPAAGATPVTTSPASADIQVDWYDHWL